MGVAELTPYSEALTRAPVLHLQHRAFCCHPSTPNATIPNAQFTPKSVETAEERHNLTFRVKLQLDKNRLREYEPFVKSGLPGMGYVRFDDKAPWPENLQVKAVDPRTLWNATGSGRAN